jgi:hypothetical protein
MGDDAMQQDEKPSAVGLLRCLRMLADEAVSLELTRTLAVLQQAMEICRTEATTRKHLRSAALH